MYGEYLGDSAVAKQEIIAACNFSRGREKQTDFKYNLERAPADFGDMGMREGGGVKRLLSHSGHCMLENEQIWVVVCTMSLRCVMHLIKSQPGVQKKKKICTPVENGG